MSDYTVAEMKEFCRQAGIGGFSGKLKDELLQYCIEKGVIPKASKSPPKKKKAKLVLPTKFKIEPIKRKATSPPKVAKLSKKKSKLESELEDKIKLLEDFRKKRKRSPPKRKSPKKKKAKKISPKRKKISPKGKLDTKTVIVERRVNRELPRVVKVSSPKAKVSSPKAKVSPPPRVGLVWNAKNKMWIDEKATQFLLGKIYQHYNFSKMGFRQMLWRYEQWPPQVLEAWNNKWLDWDALLEYAKKLNFKDAIDKLTKRSPFYFQNAWDYMPKTTTIKRRK